MKKIIGHVTILVRCYNEAVDFHTDKLGFELFTDIAHRDGKRWVTVAPAKETETCIGREVLIDQMVYH